MKAPFLGLALGGGGFRGAAHLGVLQEFDKAKIKIDCIAGVSAGAIVAAMYAYSLDGRWVEERFRQVWSSDIFNKKLAMNFSKQKKSRIPIKNFFKSISDYFLAITSFHRQFIIDTKSLEEILLLLIPERSFNQLKIPLKIVSTDLQSGDDIIHEKGDIIDALTQSCAIPGIIEPILQGEKLIVDGGVGMPIPINPLKKDCGFIIAVDIGNYKFQKLENPNILSIKKRSQIITSNRLKHNLTSKADFIIIPDTMGVDWSSYEKVEKILENGRMAASENIFFLKEMIDKKKNMIMKKNNG